MRPTLLLDGLTCNSSKETTTPRAAKKINYKPQSAGKEEEKPQENVK